MFKFCVLFALIVAATAHYIPSSYQQVVLYQIAHNQEKKADAWTPITYVHHAEPKVESWTEKPNLGWEQKEAEKSTNYDFKYEVHDEKTGDIKRQSETGTNGAVKGQYSLIDSDGFRRLVEYTADDVHGFQATVKREPTSYKIPQPAAKAPNSYWQEEPNIEAWTEKANSEWENKNSGWAQKNSGWEQKNAGWEQKEAEKSANYDFKYEVHDEKTGDIKRQSETASNGAVKGQYSLIDSDGFRRVVDYTADDVHGFQATVKREPTSHKIAQPAPKAEEHKTIAWW